MKIAIIGTGKMGRGFALALAPKHQVTVGSRDGSRAGQAASATGATRGATYADAAADTEVVILTVPWHAIEETLTQLGDLNGRVVVDVSYPYKKGERQALKGSSTAGEIQKPIPRARVFKGWNHVHARDLTSPEVEGIAASVLIAGDDPDAKEIVFGLAKDMGFHPVDVGPLKATRDLERLVGVMLFVRLGPLRGPVAGLSRAADPVRGRPDRLEGRFARGWSRRLGSNREGGTMNLNSVLIGSENPQGLTDYYTKLFGKPAWDEGGFTGWLIGSGSVTVGPHDQVKGKNSDPGRMMWNIETSDVKGEFAKLKAAGATVVQEPYQPGGAAEMWIATFSDPDNNYFQLLSTM